jgi:hypothetical protein
MVRRPWKQAKIMLVLVLGTGIVWKRVVLPTFQRAILPLPSALEPGML